jgi:hypothetical protein
MANRSGHIVWIGLLGTWADRTKEEAYSSLFATRLPLPVAFRGVPPIAITAILAGY